MKGQGSGFSEAEGSEAEEKGQKAFLSEQGRHRSLGKSLLCWLVMEHTKLSSGLSEGSCDASRMAKQSKNVAYRPSENKQTNNNPEMQSRIYACP